MSDPLSIARWLDEQSRLEGSRPPLTEIEREFLLTAAEGMRHLSAITNAIEQFEPHGITLIPG